MKVRQLIQCENCGKTKECKHYKKRRFCDQVCYSEYMFHTVKISQIEQGLVRKPAMLKKYLTLKKGYCCEICGNEGRYENKPLTLQLDHIDGNSDNNFPTNLRFLCPNCHSQTETFGYKGLTKQTKRNAYLRAYKS